jgi:tetratricopeptide (TPR) repeat protein
MSTTAEVLVPDALPKWGQELLAASNRKIRRLPPLPWRDPHCVCAAELSEYIATLNRLCELHPHSSALRTVLGIAYAMNYDVYPSMDALEKACELDPSSFLAQLKYSELLFRLRILERAEQEAQRALSLAEEPWEYFTARRQLQEIRKLRRDGTQRPAWTKPLAVPGLVLLAMVVLFSIAIRFTG